MPALTKDCGFSIRVSMWEMKSYYSSNGRIHRSLPIIQPRRQFCS